MGNKYIRTKCYWCNEYQDMNAIVPTCDYYGQYGSCPCSDECEHYISEQEVESIIRKRTETEHSHEDGQWFDLTDALTVKRNEWIPCSERLPKKGEVVLITNKKGNVRCGQYRSEYDVRDGTHYWWWKGKTVESVLAWMPLPKPYRKDGE